MNDMPAPRVRTMIADTDIHHSPRDFKLLYRYLPQHWQDHLSEYGQRARQGNASGPQYPKGQPDASRRDAWPPVGGRPGSDLEFLRTHHLDANGIEFGVLNMIRPHPGGFSNLDLSVAVARAINNWQVAEWTQPEPRLKASLVVPYEDPAASVAEIRRWAGHKDIVQVLLLSRTRAPLGNPRYWPIFRAAAEAGWPVGIHAFGNGGHPVTSHGWPSHYVEDMLGHAQSCQAMLTSMVVEGLFEAVPDLKVVLIEAGFGWLPSLAWRLDKAWRTLRAETPHLTRRPSEVLRQHVWLTTQPMEEPEDPAHLRDCIAWIGWDRLLFATDYPHWDYDDPERVLPMVNDEEKRRKFFLDNAVKLYTRG